MLTCANPTCSNEFNPVRSSIASAPPGADDWREATNGDGSGRRRWSETSTSVRGAAR